MRNSSAVVFGAVCGALGLATPAHASYNDQFICDAVGDGYHIVVISSDDPKKAQVQYQLAGDLAIGTSPDAPLPMAAVPAGSGMKYVGSGYTFHAKGNQGILTAQGIGDVTCKLPVEQEEGEGEATEDAAGSPYPVINVGAKSYGGKVRNGPGMHFDQIASIYEGNRITLLQNTGVTMIGYDWFRIRFGNGREGYQWGGLICSDELHVVGIYRDCE